MKEVQAVPTTGLNDHTAPSPGHQRSAYSPAPGKISGLPRKVSSRTAVFVRALIAQRRPGPTEFATSHAYVVAQARSISSAARVDLGRGAAAARAARRRARPRSVRLRVAHHRHQLVPAGRGGSRLGDVGEEQPGLGRLRGPRTQHAVHVDGGVLGLERRLEGVERRHPAPRRSRPAAGRRPPTCSPATGPGPTLAPPRTSRPAAAGRPARETSPDAAPPARCPAIAGPLPVSTSRRTARRGGPGAALRKPSASGPIAGRGPPPLSVNAISASSSATTSSTSAGSGSCGVGVGSPRASGGAEVADGRSQPAPPTSAPPGRPPAPYDGWRGRAGAGTRRRPYPRGPDGGTPARPERGDRGQPLSWCSTTAQGGRHP